MIWILCWAVVVKNIVHFLFLINPTKTCQAVFHFIRKTTTTDHNYQQIMVGCYLRVMLITTLLFNQFRCDYTLFKFYLSPNCTDNYVGYMYRIDTVSRSLQKIFAFEVEFFLSVNLSYTL